MKEIKYKRELIDGEQYIIVNGIKHWCKIKGADNRIEETEKYAKSVREFVV